MTTHLEIVTTQGERWDLLAWRYYGDPTRYEPIITANPHVPIVPILESGWRLAIPVLDRESAPVLEADLPPWKRGL
jgi:phage tail protein X